MGHQFPRAVVAAAVALALSGCGGSDGDGDPPPVLDVAREQVAEASVSSESSAAAERGADGTDGAVPAELPPPDPSTFEGAHRVVNLAAGSVADGVAPAAIDVWARRTFTNGPVLLAADIGFGEVSTYFSAPGGSRVVIVSAGAGPDGEERAALPEVVGDGQVTTVFADGDDPTSETAMSLYERASDRVPAPTTGGNGLVVVVAAGLQAFGDELTTSVGGQSFLVGDGSTTCRAQRIEATGAAAEILGDVDRIELEVSAGPSRFSLHPWPSPNGCDQPSVVEVSVDVVEGATTLLLVFTVDGTSVETLTLPVDA